MNNDTEIRQAILSTQAGIKRLMLSEQAVRLWVDIDKAGGLTTHQVASALGISTQSASGRLRRLYDLGYLSRNELTAESGGIEYMYYAVWE